ncbi:MAG: poly(R)-hydroxyalkanoic acid synthase subunit PhaE [Sulfurifustis sp.]
METEERGSDDAARRFTAWPHYFAALFGIPAPDAGDTGTWLDAVAKVAVPPGSSGFLEYVIALSRPYFSMAERLADAGREDPQTDVQRWLDNMAHAYSAAAQSANVQMHWQTQQAFAFWEYAFANLQQSVAALLPRHDAPPPAASGTTSSGMAPFPMLPGIGYLREMQEEYQKLARLTIEYVGALQAYNAGVAGVGLRAIERLRAKAAAEPQEIAVDSLRKLYDAWVDACEEAYATYAMSDEGAARYADLIKAAAALRRQATAVTERILEWLNVPTRREVDTLAQRLHETRREMHALRAEIERMKQHSNSAPEQRANSTH